VSVTSGTYAGRTPEQRRAQRRQRLIAAALDLIGEGGIAAVKVRVVSERAGLNDRYFYESFADCDQLVLAVFDDRSAAGLAAVTSALLLAPTEARARGLGVIAAAVAFIDDDPRHRRLFLESQATDGLRARRGQLVGILARMVVAQARELLGDHVAAQRNTELAALTVVSGLFDLTTHWLRGDLDIDRAQLVEFIVAMFLTSAEITRTLDRELTDAEDPAGS